MAKKKDSLAEAETSFDPSDFQLSGPTDKVVSKVVNGKTVYNVFSGITISNLPTDKEGLVDGVWTIEEELTQEVRESMIQKLQPKQEVVPPAV